MEEVWLWIVVLALLIGGPYASYRIGRRLERRDLTKALVQEMSHLDDIYQIGFVDGQKQGLITCGK